MLMLTHGTICYRHTHVQARVLARVPAQVWVSPPWARAEVVAWEEAWGEVWEGAGAPELQGTSRRDTANTRDAD